MFPTEDGMCLDGFFKGLFLLDIFALYHLFGEIEIIPADDAVFD